MEKDLRKKLEEAADSTFNGLNNNCYIHMDENTEDAYKDGFRDGAECGYKEAIAWAKEWWKSYYKLPDYYYSETRDVQEKMRDNYKFHMGVVADFESYMNKLWENEK